jgi:hypothetical protein
MIFCLKSFAFGKHDGSGEIKCIETVVEAFRGLALNEHLADTSTMFAVPLEPAICLGVQTTGRKSDSGTVGILLGLAFRDGSLDIAIQNH